MTRSSTEHRSLARTVVICAYTMERWELLTRAVETAAGELTNDDELIVVIDHNDSLLSRAGSAFRHLAKVVANDRERGLSGARNTGVSFARGSLVVFLDDDAAAEPGWLTKLTSPFDDSEVIGVGGASAPEWAGGTAPWWLPEEFYWVVGCSYRGLPTHRAPVRNPIGCNMALRTGLVREVGGFSSALGRVDVVPVGGEETDIAIRMTGHSGGKVMYEPSALVRHHVSEPRMTVDYFVRRCFAEGRSKAILSARVGSVHATSAERAYLGTLARGASRRLLAALRTLSLRPLGQILALVAGTAITGAGFGLGTVQLRFGSTP